MKAVRYHSTGGPDVLSYEDAPTPIPIDGEALVRVVACGVNRIDVWARSGRYKTPLPHILGTDVAGEVVSVAPSAGGPGPGSRVMLYPVISDGECFYCRSGQPNLCLSRGFVGTAVDGGYAEYVKVPASNLIPVEGFDLETAAALPVNFGTAWGGLAGRARVGPRDTVLVWGAAGGVGHAAVQVSKVLGAKVIAAVGDDGKAPFVRSLGAEHVVNYKSESISERVRSLTDGLGATVVFDHVGGDTWSTSIECLARGGKMVTLGLTSGAKSEVDVRRVYQDELSIMGIYGQSKEDLLQVLRLAREGRLKPAVQRRLPMSSAREAHVTLEAREVLGKILLIP